MKILVTTILLLLLGVSIIFWGGNLGLTPVERTPPEIVIAPVPGESLSYTISVSDVGAGLDTLLVEATQEANTFPLLSKRFEGSPARGEAPVSIRGVKGIKEGSVELKVKLWDSSFWQNTSEKSESFLVDFKPPRLQVISLQHVAAQGGAEFITYKASDDNLLTHGVQVGEIFFPGAAISDAGFKGASDNSIYASLFALPLGFERTSSKLELVALDSSGNRSAVTLNFRIESKAQRDTNINLSDDFLMRKNPELFPGYQRWAAENGIEEPVRDHSMEEPAWQFMLVNRDYRRMLDERLKEITRESNRPRLWKEVFIKPMPSATSSTFGERRTYTYKSRNIGNSVHNGVDLASVRNDAVVAANEGVVVLAEEFGIYGNTILIDHGLGLFTLYGHLSSMAVSKDDTVSRGQEIGRSGETGLAGGDHLHFEFRLREVPITPIEWWDAKWINDNIEGKLEELSAPSPL
ncbi:MAG: M23 family metallopeptidase [Deltaproteobacteria bacterium]|nr:M23 family metallopeptidase [Deltaproteobacteria bacterium]